MKKFLILSLILFLLALAASAQRGITADLRRNIIPLRRSVQYISPEIYRQRIELLRLEIARERILKDGIVSTREKRKLKKIKQLHRHLYFKKRHPRRLSISALTLSIYNKTLPDRGIQLIQNDSRAPVFSGPA